MVCVYCVPRSRADDPTDSGFEGQNGKLLFFVLVVQASDVLQRLGKFLGRHKIAPTVSPNKTWEGFLGGIATATLLGTALRWATVTPWQATGMSLVITLMGLSGVS
jgi:phosphatidate cytidylyltransferase